MGMPSTTLTGELVDTTQARRKPVWASSARYSSSVRSCPPGITSIARSSSLIRSGVSPGGHHRLDDQHSAGGLYRPAAMAENDGALGVGPILNHMGQLVGIPAGRDALEEIDRLQSAAIFQTTRLDHFLCLFQDMWQFGQHSA
jgi:hypothetical protein